MALFPKRVIPSKLNFGFPSIAILFYCLFLVTFTQCGGPPQYSDDSQETPAVLQLTANSVVDFPDTVAQFNYDVTISIENLSVAVPASQIEVVTPLSAPFDFNGSPFTGGNGTCGNSLSGRSSCQIALRLLPTSAGQFSSSFTLSYFDGLEQQSLTIELNLAARDPQPAQLSLNPSGNINYGIVAVNGYKNISFTLDNSGELAANSLTFSILSAPFSISQNNCGVTLAAGDSCQFTVQFSPINEVVSADTLSLTFFDGFNPQNLSLNFSGEGRVAGFIEIDEGPNLDFGILLSGNHTDRSITVRNSGAGAATTVSLSGLGPRFGVVSHNCPSTLNPGASCSAVLRYTSLSTNSHIETLSVNYNNGFNSTSQEIDLSGLSYAQNPTLTLVSPSTPSQNPTPQIRVAALVNGLTVRLYRDNTCTNQVAIALTPATSLDFSPTISEGTHEFHVRVEDDEANLSGCSTNSLTYEYDVTPPQMPSTVTFASNYTSSANQTPLIQWTASSSGDVVNYQTSISQSASGGEDIATFTSQGNTTSATHGGLSLVDCQYYYASVRSVDDVGLISTTFSTSAQSFRYDASAPTAPSNLNESGDSSINNSATITWSSGSDNCALSHYEVAVSEDLNDNGTLDSGELENAVSFTDVGLVNSHRFNAISLSSGKTHFTSIRSVDTTGRYSTVATSDPWIVYDPSTELPNMIVWLDANDGSTLEDNSGRNALDPAFNGSVQNWLDKSGSTNDHDFKLSGGSTRPTYDTDNFEVSFNGSSTGMTTNNHAEINTATVDQRNITVAFRTSSDISSRQVLYEEGGSIRGMNIYIFNNEIYCGFYNTPAGDGDGSQPFTWVQAPINTDTNYFVTWVFDYTFYSGPSGPDGDLSCYLNGSLIGSTNTTSRLFAHSGAVGLGHIDSQTCYEDSSCPNSGSYFLGTLYEVMLFNNAPNSGDVSNIHQYLNNKWN